MRRIHGLDDIGYCYRAYRLPYEWAPQLEVPTERRVNPPHNNTFHISPEE